MNFNDFENELTSLDSEYRESFAHALVDLKYISDTPLALSNGTMADQIALEVVMNKKLTPKDICQVVDYIKKDMTSDYQYGQFNVIANRLLTIANNMEMKMKNKEKGR